MSIATSSLSGLVISHENLLFDFPEADLILRSRDSYDFRVLKLYIVHSSPVLGEKVLICPNPQPEPSAPEENPAESNVEGTAANVPCVVQLPIEGAVLFSLLTYIFPVPPVLPSTVELAMELLSVAQMYKMDVVLTHIRRDIAQQQPAFIREETAFLIYPLAQKYGLRTEALEAARCTLSFSSLTIEDLSTDHKLDMMPGASLHELWKYHQRVRSNLTSDLGEFINSNAVTILGDWSCDLPANSGVPHWLDKYISDIGTARVPAFLDFTDFYMGLAEHIKKRRSKGCACSGIPRKNMRAFWGALTGTVHGSIAKVRVSYVSASQRGPEHLYRQSQILHFLLRKRGLKIRAEQLARSLCHRSIRICPMQMSSSSHLTLSISVSINQRWLPHLPFLVTCFLSPNPQAMQLLASFPWCTYLRMQRS
jgi:hypothetical protein